MVPEGLKLIHLGAMIKKRATAFSFLDKAV
jgi:hypothetical protein